MSYKIGLDIGIASVGWACLETDKDGNPFRILDLGVRAFESAENPKDGSSLAASRRNARGSRRRTRRRVHRIERTKVLLAPYYKDEDFDIQKNVHELRYRALSEKLTEKEFSAILLYMVKHRGFKSNRRTQSGDAKEGKLLKATSENKELMETLGYVTVGEMVYKDSKFSCKENTSDGVVQKFFVRNKCDGYDKCFQRDMLLDELNILFEKQRTFGNPVADKKIQETYLNIFSSQRNFDEGPGKSKGTQKESKFLTDKFNVGSCEFIDKELRAPKATFTFEYFRLLQSLNNLKITTNSSSRVLTAEEKKLVKETALQSKEIKYAALRKLLKISESEKFNLLTYSGVKEVKEIEGKAVFSSMKATYDISKVLGGGEINKDLINDIGYILTMFKSDKRRLDAFDANPLTKVLPDNIKENLLNLSFEKFGHISIVAMKKIIPFLEDGYDYRNACDMAEFDYKNKEKTTLLNSKAVYDEVNKIGVPVVKRAVTQTIKVINSIIRQYGSPISINIELAREIHKTHDERMKIKKDQDSRYAENQRILERIKNEFGIISPKPIDIVKYRLYEEQNGKCVYSQKSLDITRIFTDGYVQIDHIIPYSRSFNDSYNNKVLVLSEENQKKGNRLPFEYLSDTQARLDAYESFVNAIYTRNYKKREMLLRKTFTKEDSLSWKERSLNDTKYISKFVMNLLQDNLLFESYQDEKKKQHVFSLNGSVTADIRKKLGISKIRTDGDTHHAVDACVIAVVTQSLVQKYANYSKRQEIKYIGNEKYVDPDGVVGSYNDLKMLPEFMPDPFGRVNRGTFFTNEIEHRLLNDPLYDRDAYIKMGYTNEDIDAIRPVFVSRMPSKKAKGEIHKATIKSAKYIESGILTQKVSLTKLKLDKDNEIENYFNPASDKLLYSALKQRLLDFNGDAKKAFVEPFYKPKSNGENGAIVRKVKITEPVQKGFEVKKINGYAENGDMIRVDIFSKEGKYYGVPIYTKDFYAKELPNKAVLAAKSIEEWPVMDESYTFLFALQPYDLVEVEHKSEIVLTKTDKSGEKISGKKFLLYYRGFNVHTGGCLLHNHDNSYLIGGLGIKTLKSLKKCNVDMLGNISYVKNEVRQDLK